MKLLCVFFLLLSLKSFAQYPFEKYPVKKYDSTTFEVTDLETDSNTSSIAIAKYKDYKIKLLEGTTLKDGSNILLYYKNKLIKKITRVTHLGIMETPFPLYIYDEGGKVDFIIAYYSGDAVGLASTRVCKVYLCNNGNNVFNIISTFDFYSHPNLQCEFKHDGNYEIVGQDLVEYKGHNYWLFDLYNYKNGKLINVSKKYGYPIAIPYLFNETFKVTNKIPKKDLARLSLKVPEFYSIN